MSNYFRSPEMQNGGPFFCLNCKKKLAVKIRGNCHIEFLCPRCKSFISIKMKEPINWSTKREELKPIEIVV